MEGDVGEVDRTGRWTKRYRVDNKEVTDGTGPAYRMAFFDNGGARVK